jgi:hypothetical protein
MVDYNLLQDETVLEEGSMGIVGGFVSSPILSLFTFGIAAWLVARNSGVAITDQRIILKEGGLLGSNTSEIRLDNVQGVSEEGSYLNVSNAAGESMKVRAGDPSEIRNAINRAQN